VDPVLLALVALFAPVAATAAIAVSRRGAAALTVGATSISLVAALLLVARGAAEPVTAAVDWLRAGGVTLGRAGVHVDGVSVVMLTVVTFVALCVQIYSIGYLADEPARSRRRYFAFHALFLFAMELLVLAPDLLTLFAGWELVGLCSYLLIGYWYQRPVAARAATKAFWIVKLADSAFVLALVVVLAGSGGLAWDASLPPGLAEAAALLLLVAVAGKSAQLPLHVWLPDAMAGPTPVSALLHAATMVAAGVYLVVRADAIFEAAPLARGILAHAGAITAVVAGLLALRQSDLKRLLAYSTCSQLGFMLAGLGAGAVAGGYFHLATHAAFKALLFLAAGSLIHAAGGNTLDGMRGLGRRLPVTGAVFVVGALALAAVPGLSGFFSKDLILEGVTHLPVVAALLLAAGFVTALYVGRALGVLFARGAGEAHECAPSMLGPLVALAIPAAGAGLLLGEMTAFVGRPAAFHLGTTGLAASALALGGLAIGWRLPGPRAELARPIDRFYELVYARVLMAGAAIVAWLDRYIVDGLMNGAGAACLAAGRRLRARQTGNAQDYLLAVAGGAIALLVWVVMR
jgi:NADH-quinone oxidoreductase subunit L